MLHLLLPRGRGQTGEEGASVAVSLALSLGVVVASFAPSLARSLADGRISLVRHFNTELL